MAEYLAKYVIFADLYKRGFFVPNSKPYKQQYRFDAPDPKEATDKANEYMKSFLGTFFNAKPKLEELIRVG